MKITDLLKKEGVALNQTAADQNAAIDIMVNLHDKVGNLNDKEAFKKDIEAREAKGSTAVGMGIAVPHAKSAAVKEAGLVAMTVPEGVDEDMAENLLNLLSGGGLQSMMWTISLIMLAMCFGGIVDSTGIMANLADSILKLARGTRGGLVIVTELTCVFVNAICCDQYLSIILPGRMYKEAFEDRRLKPKNLSRCLEDSGTITSNFFPWNTCGATMRSFLGVNSAYIPFAVLNYVNPLVSMFYGVTGITMEEMTEEEYQHILNQREEDKKAALEAAQA